MRCTASRVLRIPLAPKCWQWPKSSITASISMASMLKSGRSNIIHIIVNEFDSPSTQTRRIARHRNHRARADAVRGANPVLSGCRQTRAGQQPVLRQLFDGEIIHASGLNAGVPLSAINHGRPLVSDPRLRGNAHVRYSEFPERRRRAGGSAASHRMRMPPHRHCRRRVFATNRTGARGKFQRFASTRGRAAHCLTPGCRMTNRRTSLVTVATAASKPVMPSPRRCSRLVRNRLMTLLSPVPGHHAGNGKHPGHRWHLLH